MEPSNAETYDAQYYAWQREGAAESARAMLPVVFDLVSPSSLLDVGCGTGAWLRVASELGVADIFGVDGGSGGLVIPAERFKRVDLEQPLELGRKFDLAMCMEVAEHLSGERARSFVADLARAADVVLFGAAIPGQGDPASDEHVNEQWQSYWADLFTEHGYRTVDAIRPRIWNDDRIAFWYRQNAFLALAPSVELELEGPTTVNDVVHPGLWAHVNSALWSSDASAGELLRNLPRALERAVKRRVGGQG
jgi:SAM-dependent methyltransferase